MLNMCHMYHLNPFTRSVDLFNFAFWRAVRSLYAGPDDLYQPNKNKLSEVDSLSLLLLNFI